MANHKASLKRTRNVVEHEPGVNYNGKGIILYAESVRSKAPAKAAKSDRKAVAKKSKSA